MKERRMGVVEGMGGTRNSIPQKSREFSGLAGATKRKCGRVDCVEQGTGGEILLCAKARGEEGYSLAEPNR